MADNDWDQVTVLRRSKPKSSTLKTNQQLAEAQRKGQVEAQKKFAAGTNRQHAANTPAAKLDDDLDEFKRPIVEADVGRLIQQARQQKEWTQKDLAQKINEKPQVVNEFESGRAPPNQQILAKLERALGVKLRGKDKGQPLTRPSKKK